MKQQRRSTIASLVPQIALVLCLGAGALSPSIAHAFQTAKVAADGATVFTKPDTESSTVTTLKAGTSVNIGDKEKNGFYRATAAHGVTGWVQADALIIKKKPAPVQAEEVASPSESSSSSSADGIDHKYTVGGLLGLAVGDGTGMFTFGADFNYRIKPTFGAEFMFTYGAVGSGLSLLNFIVGGDYYFPDQQVKGLWVGGKLGLSVLTGGQSIPAATYTLGGQTYTTPSVSGTYTAFLIGASGGYDYPIGPPGLTVGGELDLMIATAGGSALFMNLLGAVKYGF